MRTASLLLTALVLLLAGCGGGEDTSANQSTEPDTTVATTPTGTEGTTTDDDDDDGDATTDGDDTTTGGDDDEEGDADNGREVFAANGCGSCHTLAAAGSSGSVGPNLDESEPDFDLVVERVTNGSGAMPSFGDELSEQEIRDVAAFVSESADS